MCFIRMTVIAGLRVSMHVPPRTAGRSSLQPSDNAALQTKTALRRFLALRFYMAYQRGFELDGLRRRTFLGRGRVAPILRHAEVATIQRRRCGLVFFVHAAKLAGLRLTCCAHDPLTAAWSDIRPSRESPRKSRKKLDKELEAMALWMPTMIAETGETDQIDAFAGRAEMIEAKAGPDDLAYVCDRLQKLLVEHCLVPADEGPCA